MKRCPQCEFIYEDEQSLCDMDGILLVFDSRTLPELHTGATVSAPLRGKPQRRNRMAPAFATLLLMVVVGSVYYVSTTRNSAKSAYAPASVTSTTAEAEAPAPVPTPDANPVVLPADEPAAPTDEHQPSEARETEASPAPKPAAAPATKSTTTKPPATTKPAPKKDDSKVESFLKKTGKILKKPFKL